MINNIPAGKELDIFLAMPRETQMKLLDELLDASDAITNLKEAIQREVFWAYNNEDKSISSPHYEAMGVLLFETLQEIGEITYD